MPQQEWLQTAQCTRPEDHIAGPLTLERRPVILRIELVEDFAMQRVQAFGKRLQSLRPVHLKLLIEQMLGSGQVLNPGKTIVQTTVPQPPSIHTASQLFPAVDAQMNVEREPG